MSSSYTSHDYPEIIQHANDHLKPNGTLSCDKTTNFCFLKVPNEFIYDSFNFLKKRVPKNTILLPDYFDEDKNNIGAHITLVYHEEMNSALVKKFIEANKSLSLLSFSVDDFISVHTFHKTYYALLVNCSKLDEIRKKFNLPKKLNYNGLLVPFHITIAISKEI